MFYTEVAVRQGLMAIGYHAAVMHSLKTELLLLPFVQPVLTCIGTVSELWCLQVRTLAM